MRATVVTVATDEAARAACFAIRATVFCDEQGVVPEAELDVLRKVAATIAVKDVDETRQVLEEMGAAVLAGPLPTPVGRNLIARHPDGAVYEYADRRA